MSLKADFFDAAATGISGLDYRPDYVDPALEARLVAAIDTQPWRDDLKRRVQHFGYKYDYRARRVTAAERIGPIPAWLRPISARLVDERLFDAPPDQVIVNEYEPGQGIAPHVDCEPCFGGVIASLSLLSRTVMRFAACDGSATVDVALAPRSLLILRDAARYDWRHGIAARKSDPGPDGAIGRSRRLSLTFRTVRVSHPAS